MHRLRAALCVTALWPWAAIAAPDEAPKPSPKLAVEYSTEWLPNGVNIDVATVSKAGIPIWRFKVTPGGRGILLYPAPGGSPVLMIHYDDDRAMHPYLLDLHEPLTFHELKLSHIESSAVQFADAQKPNVSLSLAPASRIDTETIKWESATRCTMTYFHIGSGVHVEVPVELDATGPAPLLNGGQPVAKRGEK